MISDSQILSNINELISLNQSRRGKYFRNYRRYNNTPYMNLDSIKSPDVVGYRQETAEIEEDTTPTPSLNIIKSCIDTLFARIAQSKVRPYFNCVNGSYKDMVIVRQAQQFFDQYFDNEDVNKKVSEAFRDSCIFDTGVVYVDSDTKNITRALPWQVFVRPSESTYNNITRAYYERKDFPVTMLPDDIYKLVMDYNDAIQYITYGLYYDVKEHIKVYYIKDISLLKTVEYDGNMPPFVFLHYNNPIKGNTSLSVVDMLNSIQLEIDNIMCKVKDASQLTPANTIFVPDGSTIKSSQIANRVAQIMTYTATPNMTSSPVTVATPAFIDPSYMSLVNELRNAAYEMVGVSQLSAQSKKPSGLDSGIALQTMENVEAGRFETQLNQVIRAYVDVAKTCLRIFPKDEDILPELNTRVSVKWADIVDETKKMQIQFSAADSLSKDPSTKLQQLIALSQAGVIPNSRISQFMEIPDLQSGYSLANNAINAVLTVIDDCLNNDNFDIPEYIPYSMLKEEIINTQLSLRAANYDKNKKDIKKLSDLYTKVEDMEQSMVDDSNASQIGQQAENEMIQENQPTDSNQSPNAPQSSVDMGNVKAQEPFNQDLDVNTNNNH